MDASRSTPGKVVIYSRKRGKDGNVVEWDRWPVDAKDMLATGDYVEHESQVGMSKEDLTQVKAVEALEATGGDVSADATTTDGGETSKAPVLGKQKKRPPRQKAPKKKTATKKSSTKKAAPKAEGS